MCTYVPFWLYFDRIKIYHPFMINVFEYWNCHSQCWCHIVLQFVAFGSVRCFSPLGIKEPSSSYLIDFSIVIVWLATCLSNRAFIILDLIVHLLGKLVPLDGKITSRMGWRTSRIDWKTEIGWRLNLTKGWFRQRLIRPAVRLNRIELIQLDYICKYVGQIVSYMLVLSV